MHSYIPPFARHVFGLLVFFDIGPLKEHVSVMCLWHDSSLSSTFQVGLSHLVHLEDTFPQVVERVQSALVARGAMPHGICQRTKFDLLYLLQMDIEKTLKTPEC